MSVRPAALLQLARSYGLQLTYRDWRGTRRNASNEALVGALRALGIALDNDGDVRSALDEVRAREAAPGIDPVHVAWDGVLDALRVRNLRAGDRCRVRLRLESGEESELEAVHVSADVSRSGVPILQLQLGAPLRIGYHDVTVECGGDVFRSRILAGPRRAHLDAAARAWGAFMPLYAFGDPTRGAGTYRELREATHWVGSRGGAYLATLPLLASFLDAPFEPSPYAPASRLFWNELFIDERELPVPIAASSRHARGEYVDYRAIARDRRTVVEDAAARFFAAGGDDDREFRAFAAANPRIDDYARFRAACDRFRAGWPVWPERARDGLLDTDDRDRRSFDYHRFAAWCADAQLARVAESNGAQLYLDMPLGVHPDSYDAWRERALFARGASAGAPPDALFIRGQDWGFPPMQPRALRASGYAYFIESMRHHLRRARMLRLDHVMSLQRLYWIPRGLDATDGVYVRYPIDELLAIITIESTRHGAVVVGEDLGTVSREIRAAMRRHALQRMYVVQYEANPDADPPLNPIARDVVASLNTHDMPPFAAFWSGLDVEDQRDLGLVDVQQERAARAARARLRARLAAALGLPGPDPRAGPALRALLRKLAVSPARFVLVNVEDLWLETRPQNVPGTSSERPNWRRRARYSIQQLMREPQITELLADVDRLRRTPAARSRRREESHV